MGAWTGGIVGLEGRSEGKKGRRERQEGGKEVLMTELSFEF